MTACFTRPTIDQLYTQISSLFVANVLGGAPLIPESNEYYVVGNDVASAELYFSLSNQQWLQTQDATACCDALIANNKKFGFVPRGKTFTSGYISIQGGPPSDPIPSNLQAQIGSNTYNLSTMTNANPTTLDASGNAILLMQSETPGQDTNDATNVAIQQISVNTDGVSATLTIIPPGWPSVIFPQGNFCGGLNAETCEEFRSRVIARKQLPPNFDFEKAKEALLEYPCVTRVLLRTCGECCTGGRLFLYAMMDASFVNGIAPASALLGAKTYLFGDIFGLGRGKVPVGIFGDIFTIHPAPLDISFFNMDCITPSQFNLIKTRLGELFATLVPGERVPGKWIDSIVIGVNPNCINYRFNVNPQTANTGGLDCDNDFQPECDFLPVLGNVTYTSQAN